MKTKYFIYSHPAGYMPKYVVIRHGIQWYLRYVILDYYNQ